jgi:fructosamine-3-kinase
VPRRLITLSGIDQVNEWRANWADFWDEMRLGHMLRLCKRDGASFPKEAELRAKVREILSKHEPPPSLVHGDLWTGNAAVTSDGAPIIFDPATYYGDREVDIAMTTLFGAFPDTFYRGYEVGPRMRKGARVIHGAV